MAELVTKTDLEALTVHFDAKLDNLSLRITVRLGAMLFIAVGALATLLKLT
jgi:hypothetical protein